MTNPFCDSYCSHGGVCVLERGHELPHDSRYCQWTDDEALTKHEADAILIETDPVSGPAIVAVGDLLGSMLALEES
jgi:hypothetical protein